MFRKILLVICIVLLGDFEPGYSQNTTRLFTPNDLLKEMKTLENQRVEVHGIVIPSFLVCTERGCSIENPCCNFCEGGVGLIEKDEKNIFRYQFNPDEKLIILWDKITGDKIDDIKDVKFQCSGDSEDSENEECLNSKIHCQPLDFGKEYIVRGVWKKNLLRIVKPIEYPESIFLPFSAYYLEVESWTPQ